MRPSRGTAAVALVVLALVLAASPSARGPAAPAGRQQPPVQQPPAQQPPAQQPPAGQPSRPAAQQPPAGQQPPTFRTGVNFVRVDVIVSDKSGKAIADLEPADFEVTEDGRPQAVETFKFIRVEGTAKPDDPEPRQIRSEYDEESEAARDDVRLFAIFFDDYHVRRGSAMAVRPALKAFVQNQLGPNDLVGVMYPLMPVSTVLMSRNRDSLLSAVEHFEGRKYDYTPKSPLEDQYALAPAIIVERIRNQVTLSALESLVVHMGSLREGRKAVILVSEGFSNSLPPQLNDPVAALPGMGNPARRATGVDMMDERQMFFDSVDLQDQLREVYDAANRNNTAIYALDPRGLATNEFDISEGVGTQTDRQFLQSSLDSLRTLADQTDGRAIINRNDMGEGLKQVVRDSSAYYLLGYNSTRSGADGKFHEIKVRVKRPGTQVRSRRGYWALTKEEMARSLAPPPPSAPAAVTKALGTIAEPRRGRYIRSWIGLSRGENGKTRVTFVWEPLPPVPGMDRSQVGTVLLQASKAGEAGKPYYQGQVGADPPAAPAADGAANAAAGAPPAAPLRGPSSVTFDADPGGLQLRVAVRGERGETLDLDTRDVKLPDLTAPQVTLSTPAVIRCGNAREFQAMNGNAAAVPTASREFRRTERLLVRFSVYAPGNETPAVTARVLNRAGTGMADLPVRAPQADAPFYQLDLPLAGFAAGEYLIEVKVKGAEGETTELVPMKITS